LFFYIHDVSDIFIDLLKLSNYIKAEGPKNLFAVEILYATSLVTWVYWRFYQLAKRVLYTTLILTHKQEIQGERSGKPWLMTREDLAKLPWYLEANFLLFGLLALHICNLVLLFKI